jgi:hypothetical protein
MFPGLDRAHAASALRKHLQIYYEDPGLGFVGET